MATQQIEGKGKKGSHSSQIARPSAKRSKYVSDKITSNDFQEVYKDLYGARVHWRDLGVVLGLDNDSLEAISMESPSNVKGCLQKMLAQRLQSVPLSWKDLCDSLRSPTVGRNDVAETIEANRSCDPDEFGSPTKDQQIVESEILSAGTISSLQSDCSCVVSQYPSKSGDVEPSNIPRTFINYITSNLAKQNESWDIVKLYLESSELNCEFKKLCRSLRISLNAQDGIRKKLELCVQNLDALPPIKPMKGSTDNERHALSNAKSAEDIWIIVYRYVSFYNYYLIEEITDELGTDEDKQNMTNYKKKFEVYAHRMVYKCPDKFGYMIDDDDTTTSVIVKLDESYDDCTVLQLALLQRNLSKILKASNNTLNLIKVEKGCYKLTFQAPTCLENERVVFPLSSIQQTELRDLGIAWIQCGKYEYHITSKNVMAAGDQSNDNKDNDFDIG